MIDPRPKSTCRDYNHRLLNYTLNVATPTTFYGRGGIPAHLFSIVRSSEIHECTTVEMIRGSVGVRPGCMHESVRLEGQLLSPSYLSPGVRVLWPIFFCIYLCRYLLNDSYSEELWHILPPQSRPHAPGMKTVLQLWPSCKVHYWSGTVHSPVPMIKSAEPRESGSGKRRVLVGPCDMRWQLVPSSTVISTLSLYY